MTEPRIVHMDVDAFFASIEQLRYPKLKGKPVAVGTGCIASCSYEARRFGLRAGMSLGEARRRCPSLIVLDGDQSVYRAFASRIWELASEVAPSMETFLDDAYLDLTGTRWLYGEDPIKPVAGLKERIRAETGLTVTCGLGPSRMIARMASAAAKPDGLRRVPPQEVDGFLIQRPVKDLPGVGPQIEKILHQFNVRTIGEMRKLPLDGLTQLFGKVGVSLYERCRGKDTRIIAAKEIPQSVSRETSFHHETTDRDEVKAMLYYLLERGAKTLRDMGLCARTLSLRIRYCDFCGEDGSLTASEAMSLEKDLFPMGCRLLDRFWTRRVALRFIGISLSHLKPEDDSQLSLFEEATHARGKALAAAVDEVRDRFGFSSLLVGPSIELLPKLSRDHHGYVLRTPSLTK